MPDVASDTLSLERRVDALRKTIEKLNFDYYILDQPTATDAEYDALLRELGRHSAAGEVQPDSAPTTDALPEQRL
jgi:DNA ligase (NAD+)